MHLTFLLAVTSGCPGIFSLAGLQEERLALPLLDSGTKRLRNFQ